MILDHCHSTYCVIFNRTDYTRHRRFGNSPGARAIVLPRFVALSQGLMLAATRAKGSSLGYAARSARRIPQRLLFPRPGAHHAACRTALAQQPSDAAAPHAIALHPAIWGRTGQPELAASPGAAS